jgi:hypothetical protein
MAKIQELRNLRSDVEAFRAKYQPEHARTAPATGPRARKGAWPARSEGGRPGGKRSALDKLAVVPDAYGKKGSARANIDAAKKVMEKKGGSPTKAVKDLMARSGLKEATAKRYVRAAAVERAEKARAKVKSAEAKAKANNPTKRKSAPAGKAKGQASQKASMDVLKKAYKDALVTEGKGGVRLDGLKASVMKSLEGQSPAALKRLAARFGASIGVPASARLSGKASRDWILRQVMERRVSAERTDFR